MIVIMNDGISIPWFFPRTIRKMDKSEIALIYIPSYDYQDKHGIHHSPGLARLLDNLAKKRFRDSFGLYKILSYIEFIDYRATDFELALDFLITLKILRGDRIYELINGIAEKLGIKYEIIPVIDPPSSTRITTGGECKIPLEFDAEVPDINSIEFVVPERSEISPRVKEVIEKSTKIVIIGSALTLLYLKRMEALMEMISNYKGQVIYVIPERLSTIDKAVLKHIKAEPTFAGLAGALNGNIDALVVNTSDIPSLQNISEFHFMFYPINFDSDTTEKRRRTVEEFLKILRE